MLSRSFFTKTCFLVTTSLLSSDTYFLRDSILEKKNRLPVTVRMGIVTNITGFQRKVLIEWPFLTMKSYGYFFKSDIITVVNKKVVI